MKKNSGMFGGAEEKDPLAGEYGDQLADASNAEHKLQGSAAEEAEAFIKKLAAEDAGKPPLLESPRLVKIPIDWGRRFAIAYDNGDTVEYGLGKMGVPPAGAKPLHYLMESLE